MSEEFREEYRFEYSNNRGDNIVFTLKDIVDLYEIIEKFSDFLHGVGFSFRGELGIVDDEAPFDWEDQRDKEATKEESEIINDQNSKDAEKNA